MPVCLSSELEGRETGGRERVGNNWERKERRGKEREGERKPESQEEPRPSGCSPLVWNSLQAAASLLDTGNQSPPHWMSVCIPRCLDLKNISCENYFHCQKLHHIP